MVVVGAEGLFLACEDCGGGGWGRRGVGGGVFKITFSHSRD